MEDTILSMLQNTGSFGAAVALLYLGWKGAMILKQRGFNRVANAEDTQGLPVLGGSNPSGTERSGVALQPEKQPVTNEICEARQRIITTKIDAVGEQVSKLDMSLADTNTKLDKTATKLAEGVAGLETCVAVIKDRTNRDR